MLLCNVTCEVSYAARLNIALGEHADKQSWREQRRSAQRGEDVSLNIPIWPELALKINRALGVKGRIEINHLILEETTVVVIFHATKANTSCAASGMI